MLYEPQVFEAAHLHFEIQTACISVSQWSSKKKKIKKFIYLYISAFGHIVCVCVVSSKNTYLGIHLSLLYIVISVFTFFSLLRMPPCHALRRLSSMPTGTRLSAKAQMTLVTLPMLLSWLPHHSEDQGGKIPLKERIWKNTKP